MTSDEPDPGQDVEQAEVERLARQAEDEAAAARARADAAAARAAELREQVRATTGSDTRSDSRSDVAPEAAAVRRGLAAAIAAVVITALVSATALMLWAHRDAARQRHQVAEFAAAARQSVVNLMAIDYATADDSVQRVLEGSIGRFRDNFAETSEDFVRALQEEKIITTATVNDAAVESITGDSAVVLVSATSRREGPGAPSDQQQPRVWRVVLNLQRDGGQIKMSGVEFV
ncbi:MAG: hypothetical protein KDB50_10085 [Mycobacterium sp.]|nr:hypothetical protein [Mycobacterium sp.]